jgi:hypothetical protein
MEDLHEIALLQQELEQRLLEVTGTTNQNPWAAISELAFTRFMTDWTGDEHECLGGNTEGFDVRNTVTGETYEVKHTRTTARNYVYGGLKTKSANKAVFIKWDYNETMEPEYCIVLDMSLVQENLNESCNRLYSKRLHQMTLEEGLPFEDLTNQFSNYVFDNV